MPIDMSMFSRIEKTQNYYREFYDKMNFGSENAKIGSIDRKRDEIENREKIYDDQNLRKSTVWPKKLIEVIHKIQNF